MLENNPQQAQLEAIKEAQEAAEAGAALPGTSTGGPVPASGADLASTGATSIIQEIFSWFD